MKRITYFLSFEILLNVIKGNKGEPGGTSVNKGEQEFTKGNRGNKGKKGK